MDRTRTHSTIDDYILGHTLGSGASGKVKLATREGDEAKFAIKILYHNDPRFAPV